jgi:acyl-CoA thioesterase-1
MKTILKLAFALLLCVPAVVRAQTTALSDKKLNILTLGDSNGTFAWSWPKQLQLALPNATVFNISKSGRTVGFLNNGDSTLNSLSMIAGNLKKAADATGDKPYDYIILDLGTNDGKAVFAPRQDEVGPNYAKLINTIKTSKYATINKAKIVIISPTPYGSKAEATEKYARGSARVKAMSKAFKKIAKKNGCLFVNGLQIPGLDIETQTPDGLHLDATASRKLIEVVVATMLK